MIFGKDQYVAIAITNNTGIDSSAVKCGGKRWSAQGSLSAAAHCISVPGRRRTDLILGAGAAGAEAEWTCFAGRMSHLGLDALWCLKRALKCDTPSTYFFSGTQ